MFWLLEVLFELGVDFGYIGGYLWGCIGLFLMGRVGVFNLWYFGGIVLCFGSGVVLLVFILLGGMDVVVGVFGSCLLGLVFYGESIGIRVWVLLYFNVFCVGRFVYFVLWFRIEWSNLLVFVVMFGNRSFGGVFFVVGFGRRWWFGSCSLC